MKEITLSLAVSAEMAARIIALLNASTPESTPTPAPVSAPVQAPPPAVVPPAPIPPAPPLPLPTASPQYTLEQVKRAGAELIQRQPEKMPEAGALLVKYGAKSIAEVKDTDLNAFALELKGLGAVL